MTFTHTYATNILSFEGLDAPVITAENDQGVFQAGVPPQYMGGDPAWMGFGTAGNDDASFEFVDWGPYSLTVASTYRAYTADWGNGQTTTGGLIPWYELGQFGLANSGYDYAGNYNVNISENWYDENGSPDGGPYLVGGGLEYVTDPIPTITAPDQTVASGQSADLTFNYSGYCATGTGIAFIDWGDGTGPHPVTFSGGTSGTITAHLNSAPPPGDYNATISFYDTATASLDGFEGYGEYNTTIPLTTATFTLHSYGVDLNVGGVAGNDDPAASGSAVPNAFIPLDDELSDNGVTPENELAVPDCDDPELVAGSVTISAPADMSGSWSLQFLSTVRVFEVANGTMTALTSGTDYSSTGSETIALEIQGFATDTGSLIEAFFAQSGAASSATSKVNESVAGPLVADSMRDNVAGAPLTEQQMQAGIYLPISGKVYGAFKAQLEISPIAAAPHAELQFSLPAGFQMFEKVGNTLVGVNGPFQIPQQGAIFEVEVTAVTPSVGKIALDLTSFNPANGQKLFTVQIGSVVVTTFSWSGPADVPQYGVYNYGATFPAHSNPVGAQWLPAANGGPPIAPPPNPKQPNMSSTSIQWGAGAVVGMAIFLATPEFIWDMSVNIVQVNVTAQGNPFRTGTLGVFQQPGVHMLDGRATVVVTADARNSQNANPKDNSNQGIMWMANVTLVGPNGNQGVDEITVGFLQNLTVGKFEATWGTAPAVTLAAAYYATGVALETTAQNQNTFLDTVNARAPLAFYDTTAANGGFNDATPQNNSKQISGFDGPTVQVPTQTPIVGVPGAPLNQITATEAFTTYVVATTKEAPAGDDTYYAAQASATWQFTARGTVNGMKWIPNVATIGVTGQNAWTILTGTPPAMKTSGVRFNEVVLGTHNNRQKGNLVWVMPPP